jgi:hypothetical protein
VGAQALAIVRAVLVALLLCAGCPRGPALREVTATTALVEQPGWRTLTSNHRVTVTVDLGSGKRDVRSLRGLVAVARPDRLRLRALGPAGITLFDLLVKNGEATIVASIRKEGEGTSGQTLTAVIHSLAADLACAYLLDPKPADRRVTLQDGSVLVEERDRTVRLSRFAGTPPIWRRAEITAGRYHVVVEVDDAEIEPTLDPSMFND